jgi:hypothetical protein
MDREEERNMTMTHDEMTRRLRDKSEYLSHERCDEIADRMDWYRSFMLRTLPVITIIMDAMVSDGALTKEDVNEYLGVANE